ncbi:FadR family transcriptional regulator [Brevibacillus fluminis]|uniref:FadR family transcriptional regulator n=1 Tax=Brevibacillus fluminis TaxID=511487 RepID=A0A3M8DRV4_9BACL|nr:FadR/GntR family transcriptional regulator [Brevibacillus fluminis]RNB90624.1 FadR family transcriptional regulator [Brevibacillus fluminis]
MVIVSETVQKYLLDFIRKKELKPEDKLPSERELVNMLEVSRSSIREALQTLAEQGIVEKRPGKGVYIKKNPFQNNGEITQTLMMLVDFTSSLHLLELRQGVEGEIAHLAAKRIEKADIQILEQSIVDLEVCIKMDTPIIVPDLVFHNTLARSTQNGIILQVYNSIAEFFKKVRIEMATEDDVHQALYYHKEILQAVKAGDSERSSKWMREHIEDVKQHYQKMLNRLR